MVKLHKVKKGICCLGNYNFSTKIGPVIAIHPYCNKSGLYEKRIDDFIKQYDGPIITLEDVLEFKETLKHYRSLGRLDNMFIIKTIPADPDLDEIDWEKFIKFLKKFQGRPIKLVGGYFWERGDRNRGGCLGWTEDFLKKEGFDVKILRELTFS